MYVQHWKPRVDMMPTFTFTGVTGGCPHDNLAGHVLLLRHDAVARILANGSAAFFFKAALPLAEKIAAASDRCSETGPNCAASDEKVGIMTTLWLQWTVIGRTPAHIATQIREACWRGSHWMNFCTDNLSPCSSHCNLKIALLNSTANDFYDLQCLEKW